MGSSNSKDDVVKVNSDSFCVIDPNLKVGTFTLDSKEPPSKLVENAFESLCIKENLNFLTFSPCDFPNYGYVNGFKNQLVGTVHLCFQNHIPLVLDPDVIWTTITQGLSRHITQNAESLRKIFVSHKGKKELVVVLPDDMDFQNPEHWKDVINTFSSKIEENIGQENHKLIVSNFSTTGPLQKIVSEIVLLESMKEYFEYVVTSSCGIPSVKLEGTLQDWEDIYERAQKIKKIIPDLKWWIDPLSNVLKEFVQLKKGLMSRTFWQSFYKFESGSGGDSITGHINALFPYLQSESSGKFVTNSSMKISFPSEYPSSSTFPMSLSMAPFKSADTQKNFKFIGGIIGYLNEKKTSSIKPVMAWYYFFLRLSIINLSLSLKNNKSLFCYVSLLPF